MNRSHAFGVSVLALAAGLSTAPAAARAAEAAAKSVSEIDEVIVTATRRQESLHEVPISITARTAQDLKDSGVQEMRDLAAPNFIFPETYTTTRNYVSSRGIFQEAGNLGVDSGFSVFVDGVYMGRNMSSSVDSNDIGSVEILRGPQGTLWGKNTIAGALNLTTIRPGPEFGGRVELEAGRYDLRRLKAGINVPVVDGVALRMSYHRATRDGYVLNLVNPSADKGGSIDLESGRAQLLLTPTDKLSIYVTADRLRSRNAGYAWEVDNADPRSGGDARKHTNSSDVLPRESRHDGGISGTVEYEFGGGYTLTSITARRDSRVRWVEDEDGSPFDLYSSDLRDDQRIFSQEVRLSSPDNARYDYVIGLYYLDQQSRADFRSPFSSAAGVALGLGGPAVLLSNQVVDTTSYAAFVHANFHVTEALNLFGGLRYTDETKKWHGTRGFKFTNLAGFLNDPAFILPPRPELAQQRFRIENKPVSWTAGLQYKFSPDVTGYASVAEGFKSGGFNNRTGASVNPEYLTNYELGLKTRLFDRRADLNLAAYYSDYKDLQVRDLVPPNGTVLRNAASVVAKGLEAELSARPTDELSINLGLGYTHSTFRKYRSVDVFGVPYDGHGNHLPMTPKWTVNAAVQYEHPLPDGASLVTHADFSYLTKRYASLDGGQNGPDFILPSLGLLNARVGYVSADKQWEAFAWVKNLTDEARPIDRHAFSGFGLGPGIGTFKTLYQTYSEPRTWGVSVGYHF